MESRQATCIQMLVAIPVEVCVDRVEELITDKNLNTLERQEEAAASPIFYIGSCYSSAPGGL